MSSLDSELGPYLIQRRNQHLLRQRRNLQSPQGADIVVDGEPLINFSSNDYLGLANHPRLIEAGQRALSRWGVGSGASHLVCGHSEEHHLLEQELAALVGRPRALLFSTGYMANIGTIAALCGRGDAVFEDRLNHASLLDGALLSGARLQRFQHNDTEDLERRLSQSEARRKLVVVDGVFSMDGDLSPLNEVSAVARAHGAWLMVDDAHGVGCLGETGAGCVSHWGLNPEEAPVLIGTLGKAFGSFGAFVAGSEILIETLIQSARSYIYTTALPPSQAAITREALKISRDESWRRSHLNTLIEHFKAGARGRGLELMPSATAIQPVLVGDAERALMLAQNLKAEGFWVVAIRPPTVPEGASRLRITLTASHSQKQLDLLLDALVRVSS